MRAQKLNDQEFIQVVSQSESIRQVVIAGGWKEGGGSYTLISDRIKRLKLDISHFKGQSHGKGGRNSGRPLTDYLVLNGPEIGSYKLKNRLIKANIKTHECENCHLTEWLGKPTPTELDHVNGNKHDNRIENLRILCPNCHAQTDTYCGKNIKIEKYLCQYCGLPKKQKSRKTCGMLDCLEKHTGQYKKFKSEKNIKPIHKIKWPNKEELQCLVYEKPTVQLAKDLGVSDSAIGKKCKEYNIIKPERGYWAKLYSTK